jgi:hypothetical protein
MPWNEPAGPRRYAVSGSNITVAGATTLVLVHTLAAADPQPPGYALAIVRGWCNQSANATSAQQRIQWHIKGSAFPTLTSATPQAIRLSDPASGIVGGTAGAVGTAGINASAEGAGTETLIWPDAFNVLNGWLWLPTPDEYIIVPPDTAIGLKFPVAPVTLSGWNFGLVFLEINLAGFDL